LTPTYELQTAESYSLTIKARPTDGGFRESCWWEVSVDPRDYQDDAAILIWLDELSTAEMKVFVGSDRRDTRSSIEGAD
jgi:hypothetical protein